MLILSLFFFFTLYIKKTVLKLIFQHMETFSLVNSPRKKSNQSGSLHVFKLFTTEIWDWRVVFRKYRKHRVAIASDSTWDINKQTVDPDHTPRCAIKVYSLLTGIESENKKWEIHPIPLKLERDSSKWKRWTLNVLNFIKNVCIKYRNYCAIMTDTSVVFFFLISVRRVPVYKDYLRS